MAEARPGTWRWRLLVAEAMACLIAARTLIGLVRFDRWRALLGEPLGEGKTRAVPSEAASILARAVQRGADRLPFTAKCLPRAVALHWMLRRRGLPSELVITVLDPQRRGESDAVHAWVEAGGTILIGAIDLPFVPLARFGATNP